MVPRAGQVERSSCVADRRGDVAPRLGERGPVDQDGRGCGAEVVGVGPRRREVRITAARDERRVGIVEPSLQAVEVAGHHEGPAGHDVQHRARADHCVRQRADPGEQLAVLAGASDLGHGFLHQVGGPGEVLRGQRVPDGLRGEALPGVPVAGPPVQLRDQVGVLAEQPGVQHVGEEVVVAVPRTLGVQRDQEQVVPLQVREHRGAPALSADGVAQGAGEPVEHRGPQQEVADVGRLTRQDLVGQVVQDEPVAAGERLDEVRDLRPGGDRPQRQCRELQAGDPALRATFEGGDVRDVEVQAHGLVQELPRLSGSEAQVGAAHLDQLTAAPQPRERERRIGAGGHHQAQLVGEVVEEDRDGLVRLGRGDQVVVVEHQHPPCVRRACSGHGVDHDGHRRGRVARQVLEDGRRLQVDAGSRQGGDQVAEQPDQVVVPLVQGQPGRPCPRSSCCQVGDPVAEHGRLPGPGRRRDERQPLPWVEGGVEPFSQSGARDGLGAQGRSEQLRGEHRSRHSRIIGAALTPPGVLRR